MNKRFFTLMAAVMLAGAPLCNEAFALNYSSAVSTTAKLQNGAKFILSDGSGSYYKVADVVNANVTYATFDGTTVVTDVVPGTSTIDPSKATVFEVTNLQTNALGVTFQLKVNGKLVALTTGRAIITNTTPASQIYTTFHTSPLTTGYTLDIMDLYVVESASSKIAVASRGDLQSIELSYDAENLKEFNASSTTFSFPGANLEGNVFNNVIPVASSLGGADVTYFVKGKSDDITTFFATPTKENAAKLSFVYVKNEKYGINTSVDGEGYKVVMINGADFFAPGTADWNNAAFTSIKEADQLNKEGEIELSISPKLGSTPTQYDVKIKSVKASTSDTKTYVTTVSADPNQPTRFAVKSNPTLGANSYFAASEFLKAGEVSAYNIYFTSGKHDGSEEYHKYLANISDGSSFSCNALASKYVDLNSPSTQWIVTDFDGKYTLTLTNRLDGEVLVLKLAATSTAGEYTIAGGADASHLISNLGTSLSLKTIKLLPAALTKYDGTLNLSDDEMAEGVTLAFSGANANIGAQTFYAALKESTFELYPSLNASDAVKFNVEKIKDPNKKQDVAMNITPYAYIDATGNVITADAAKADTLVVPAYEFSVDINGQTYKVADNMVLGTTSSAYLINKTMSGYYTTTYYNGTALDYRVHKLAYNNAVGVNNVLSGNKLIARFERSTKYFAPEVTGFAYLGINANDNTDYTTLPAVSRHATLENPLGAVSMQVNKNGILEGILSAEPMTFWLDTADSDQNTPHFYISKGVHNADGELAEMRNFLVYAPDSMSYFDEASASIKDNFAYYLEGTTNDLKAIFRPAALVGVDTLSAEIDGTMKTIVKKATAAGEIAALNNFQFGICLADEDVEGEYVIYSKAATDKYLYSHNGKLGFGTRPQALVVTLGEGDATANEAIEAESGVEVIAGKGVVTVQGAAGKVITVANILGQTIANQVAASDNVTIAAPAGVVVVTVDGEAVKKVVK